MNPQNYLNFKLLFLFLAIFFNCSQTNASQLDTQALGNFVDSYYANLDENEKKLFEEELRRQEEYFLKMSDQERAAYEEQMLKELDNLMTNAPELFEKPAAPVSTPPVMAAPKAIEIEKPNTPKIDNKPKPITVSQEHKEQYRQIVNSIISSLDEVLIKSQNFKKQVWHKLSIDLQKLKSQLPILINSDLVLAEFLSANQTELQKSVKDFEKFIKNQASQIVVNNDMGLNQDASKQLGNFKLICEQIIQKLSQNQLITKLNALITKHDPKKLKNIERPAKKNKRVNNLANTLNISDNTSFQVDQFLQEIQNSANQQLLSLISKAQNEFANQQTISQDLQRKLQWQLSALELHQSRLMQILINTKDANSKADLIKKINTALTANQQVNQIMLQIKDLDQLELNNELNQLTTKIINHNLVWL
jgi:hypothetical protein